MRTGLGSEVNERLAESDIAPAAAAGKLRGGDVT